MCRNRISKISPEAFNNYNFNYEHTVLTVYMDKANYTLKQSFPRSIY